MKDLEKRSKEEMNYDNLIRTIDKAKVEIDKHSGKYPYGIICSENTFNLFKKHFEDVTNQSVPNIATISGLKVRVEVLFPADLLWVLNEKDFKEVEKNGLSSLIRKMAKRNGIKLWGLDNYEEMHPISIQEKE